MPKRAVDDSPAPPPAPPVRPTARVTDAAAFAEAARPDSWLRAHVPNDVIELVRAKVCSPRLAMVSLTQARLFDTGSAEQRWTELAVSNLDGTFDSLAKLTDGVIALVRPAYIGDSKITTRFHRLHEPESRWLPSGFSTQLFSARELMAFENQLFMRMEFRGERLARIIANSAVHCTPFPERTVGYRYGRTCATRHGICLTGGAVGRACRLADIYAPTEDRWMLLPDMLTRRAHHTLVAESDGNTVLAIGGSGDWMGSELSGTAERYDFRGPHWQAIAAHPQSLTDPPACALNENCIVLTGCTSAHGDHLSSYLYDNRADAWMAAPAWDLPPGSQCPQALTVV